MDAVELRGIIVASWRSGMSTPRHQYPLAADRQQQVANSTATGRTARMCEEMVRAKERRTQSGDILCLQAEVTHADWRLQDMWAGSLCPAALGVVVVSIALRQAGVNLARSPLLGRAARDTTEIRRGSRTVSQGETYSVTTTLLTLDA
ncbi:MAG TPA: hypothetical protein VMH22_07505 [bacterium]|nr:hypothetical protein [bacterium]